MVMMRRTFVFLLIAAMSLVSGARSGSASVQEAFSIEICAEDSIRIIHVDAEGREVPADPICDCAACKHCAMPALALPPAGPEADPLFRHARPADPAPALLGPARAYRAAHPARGPPAPKATI